MLFRSAPSSVPNDATLQVWASVFEEQFATLVSESGNPQRPLAEESPTLAAFVHATVHALQSRGISHDLEKWIDVGRIPIFVRKAAEAFRDNDLLLPQRLSCGELKEPLASQWQAPSTQGRSSLLHVGSQ